MLSMNESVDDWKTARALERVQRGAIVSHLTFQIAYGIACGWINYAPEKPLSLTQLGVQELEDWHKFTKV